MSPLALWQQFFNLETTYLPLNPDELDEICCDSQQRTISHVGVELDNCRFQSFALQEIRRLAAGPENAKVQLRYNRKSMAHIWVTDPKTGDRIQVPNVDPVTARLSAAQVAATEKLRRDHKKTNGEIIQFGEALKRLREIGQSLLRANTQGKRRQGYKLLGITLEAVQPQASRAIPTKTEATALPRKKLRKKKTTSPALRRAPTFSVEQPAADTSDPAPAHVLPPVPAAAAPRDNVVSTPAQKFAVPMFNVVKRAADRDFFGGKDADPR